MNREVEESERVWTDNIEWKFEMSKERNADFGFETKKSLPQMNNELQWSFIFGSYQIQGWTLYDSIWEIEYTWYETPENSSATWRNSTIWKAEYLLERNKFLKLSLLKSNFFPRACNEAIVFLSNPRRMKNNFVLEKLFLKIF